MITCISQSVPDPDPTELAFQQLKQRIHGELVDSLDLAAVERIDDAQIRHDVQQLAQRFIQPHRQTLQQLDPDASRRMLTEMDHEIFGAGPLEPLMEDPSVSDILVNHPHEVYVERFGLLELTNIIFADQSHLLRIIQRIASRLGRRIDEVSPMVDARLPDGSRVNAVIPPLAIDGAKLCIRRFGTSMLNIDNLIENGTLSESMAEFLQAAVASRTSVLISGGTGAGKTTMLDAMSVAIPTGERLVTIEDSAELLIQHPHVVRLETRPSNAEGCGEFTQRDLVRNSLRMRPDRIIVGEVRGSEALDMLQAMNTGHEGSLTTVHANDAVDALARLEMMVATSGHDLPIDVVRKYIATGITLVVHLARLKGGVRRVTQISELRGVRENGYVMKEIFRFRQTGLDEAGRAQGAFLATGYVPDCVERFENEGVEIAPALFGATGASRS